MDWKYIPSRLDQFAKTLDEQNEINENFKEACFSGNFDLADFYFDKGANVNYFHVYNQSMLHDAVWDNKMDLIKYLVSKKANLETKNPIGETPLSFAVRKSSLEIVEFLVDNGANIHHLNIYGENLICPACENENPKVLIYLLEKGLDINHISKNGSSPLCTSLINSFSKQIKTLIEMGANVNFRNKNYGDTPLKLAVLKADLWGNSFVQILLEKGADPEISDDYDMTPVMYAISEGNIEAFKILFDYGADPYKLDNKGECCLHFLEGEEQDEIMSYIEESNIGNFKPAKSD